MIGKAAKPRCFRVRQSPIPYNNQSKLGTIGSLPSGGTEL